MMMNYRVGFVTFMSVVWDGNDIVSLGLFVYCV